MSRAMSRSRSISARRVELLVEARGLEAERALVRDREQVVEVLARELLLRALPPDGEEARGACRASRAGGRRRSPRRALRLDEAPRRERRVRRRRPPRAASGAPRSSEEPREDRAHRERLEPAAAAAGSVKAPSSGRGRRSSRRSRRRRSAVRDVRSSRSFGRSSCETTDRLISRSACLEVRAGRGRRPGPRRFCMRRRSGSKRRTTTRPKPNAKAGDEKSVVDETFETSALPATTASA